ncbi:hypothetical protein T05_7904 [Trichinella murrelli]|uniref:Uncharacterized protein n=1 Tax=Trichinella murrelli TaxID=144512 RepID=A0A0V0TRD7_9BILA|nr:hypothetical protein T05_7904 [Trichinella murrelli]
METMKKQEKYNTAQYNTIHQLEGGIKSAQPLYTLKLPETAPAFVYRWCIHPYIVQPVVAFEHKPC